jgi:ubiquinone biosynthesis protein UbiJ
LRRKLRIAAHGSIMVVVLAIVNSTDTAIAFHIPVLHKLRDKMNATDFVQTNNWLLERKVDGVLKLKSLKCREPA